MPISMEFKVKMLFNNKIKSVQFSDYSLFVFIFNLILQIRQLVKGSAWNYWMFIKLMIFICLDLKIKYSMLRRIADGSFGMVYQMQNKANN